jgi:hypothetical protein
VAENEPSELGKAVQEVSEKLQLLVSEEIALAKAEMSQKAMRLARGAAVGAAAGIFVLAGLIYFLHGVAWLIWKLLDDGGTSYFIGFLILAGILFVLGALAGFAAARSIRRGTPPKPAMAIEEAQLIRDTLKAAPADRPTGAVVPREGAEVSR